MMDGSINNNFGAENNINATSELEQPIVTQYVDQLGNPIDPSLIDEAGNYIGNNNATQYVDELGNPIDPSLIDANGNYIGNTTTLQYVDEFGNPIDPSLIDENGNYIGNAEAPLPTSIDEQSLAHDLNSASGNIVEPTSVSAAVTTASNKELLSGMVTFDYNNVPITDIVNSIILDSINKGASDIHFDPFDEGIKIRLRIDGELNDYSIVPLYVKRNMITRIKIISGMNITESRTPQDGAIRTELQNKTIDLRVSCLPTNVGEKIVIRIMDYSMSALGIEALDFSENNLDKVRRMLELPNGIILVTGATGSGKSTTVYAMLQKLNVEGTNLITVEDPIEMNIGGINQVQAQSEIGLTFAAVLRSVLRQDPDVIMIGEIRDDETARIAVRASITGHLVLSTIHTNNSLNTIERLTDMSVERYLLGSSLSGIISQKLARRLCDKCKRLRKTTDYEKSIIKTALEKDVDEIYEPVGCPECSRGYRGRIAVHEVLLLNQSIRDAITKGVSKSELRALVYSHHGTDTMLEDGLKKVLEGKTSFEEILKLIDLEDDLGTGTQLGLVNQIEASTYNNDDPSTNLLKNPELSGPKITNINNNEENTETMSGPQPQVQQTAPTPAQLAGPININIPPELLASLSGLTSLKNIADELAKVTSNDKDDDEVEETIIRKHKKKPKKVIIEEIIDDDEDSITKEQSVEELNSKEVVQEQDDDIGTQLFEEIDEIRENIPEIEIPPTPPVVEENLANDEVEISVPEEEVEVLEEPVIEQTEESIQEEIENEDVQVIDDYEYETEQDIQGDVIDYQPTEYIEDDSTSEEIVTETEELKLEDSKEPEEQKVQTVQEIDVTELAEDEIVPSLIEIEETHIDDLNESAVQEIVEPDTNDIDEEIENLEEITDQNMTEVSQEYIKDVLDSMSNVQTFDNEPVYINLKDVDYLKSLIQEIPNDEIVTTDLTQAREIGTTQLNNYNFSFEETGFKEIDDDIELPENDFNLSNTEINNLLDVLEGE